MVRHHVAQRPGDLVKIGAALDADGFGRGDLDVIDMVAVPQRLEDRVREAQRHDVLDRLLAEEMVHAEDLRLVQYLEDAGVKSLGGGKVAAKRLFDDDAPPAAVFFLGQPGRAEALDDRAEQLLGDGKVEQHIAAGLELRLDLFEQIGKLAVGVGAGEIAGEMSDAAGDQIPCLGVERLALAAGPGVRDKALDALGQIVAKGVGAAWACGRRRRSQNCRTAACPWPDCRGPASTAVWSDRRRRQKSPSCRAAPWARAASCRLPWRAVRASSIGSVLHHRARLLMAAKLMAHRRQDALGKGMVLARAETGVERRRQDLGRHRLLDRRLNGPAAFARNRRPGR